MCICQYLVLRIGVWWSLKLQMQTTAFRDTHFMDMTSSQVMCIPHVMYTAHTAHDYTCILCIPHVMYTCIHEHVYNVQYTCIHDVRYTCILHVMCKAKRAMSMTHVYRTSCTYRHVYRTSCAKLKSCTYRRFLQPSPLHTAWSYI